MNSSEYYTDHLKNELASITNELADQGVAIQNDAENLKALKAELDIIKAELENTKAELTRVKSDWKKQNDAVNDVISNHMDELEQDTLESFMVALGEEPLQ